MSDIWLFGYGSLIWRPDFPFKKSEPARVHGWVRRFWQGSHDHRGTEDRPGRVVTLIPEAAGACDGVAFLIDAAVAVETFEQLDYREKNGYERHSVKLQFRDSSLVKGRVYVATAANHAYLGPAPLKQMATQILQCEGPSGRNIDYLTSLLEALRRLGVRDGHVEALANECGVLDV